MPRNFNRSWSDLNKRLKLLERRFGLARAVDGLLEQQRKSGFIKDAPEDVERNRFAHPDDPARYLRVQYNPKRAARFKGAGRARREEDHPVKNGGCYLCRENIQWQQDGVQLGYEIQVGQSDYIALANPFPLLPGHLVIASAEHKSQDWFFHDHGRLNIEGLVGDLVALADRLPGYIGYYNGVNAGASIPGHMHFQFSQRPESDPVFPLETAMQLASPGDCGAIIAPGYPLQVTSWKGSAADVVARASDWMARWGRSNESRLNRLSANFIAARDEDDGLVRLYFAPRDREKPQAKGLSGLIGGLEILGEVVLSSPEEKVMLDAGNIDYFSLETALASINTPLYAK